MTIDPRPDDKHNDGARWAAADIDIASWCRSNTFRAGHFPVDHVLQHKLDLDVQVSLVLPTRNVRLNVERLLEQVAGFNLTTFPLIDQVLVVDAASDDGTSKIAQAQGAEVWNEADLAPWLGPVLGKCDATWRSLSQVRGDIVLFADADTIGFRPEFVCGVLAPLICHPELQFVKAAYSRPLLWAGHQLPDGGDRVTELTARPLLNMFFPEFAGFTQPLASEFGCWRRTLESTPFVAGYGIESALLIDVLDLAGLSAMAQADVGTRQNQHQSLRDLSRMSYAVARTILARAAQSSRLQVDAAHVLLGVDLSVSRYVRADSDARGVAPTEYIVPLVERPALIELRADQRKDARLRADDQPSDGAK